MRKGEGGIKETREGVWKNVGGRGGSIKRRTGGEKQIEDVGGGRTA